MSLNVDLGTRAPTEVETLTTGQPREAEGSSRRWYVVQTKHKNEILAERELKNQEFIVFCPQYRHLVHNKRKNKKIEFVLPLYPRYIFVNFDIRAGKWGAIKNTKGVLSLLSSFDNYAIPLPIGFVERLINASDQHGIIEMNKTITPDHPYKPGDKVLINANNFAGMLGIVQRIKKDKIIIKTSLLSNNIDIELPISLVSPADPICAGVR